MPIIFTAYGDESDPGPMPIPVSAQIEGYPAPGSGDRHVLVLDNNNCWLYELYSSYPNADELECRIGRRVGSHRRRAAPLHVDVGRRRGLADFPGPRALRRSRGGPDQSRAAIHAAIEPRRVRAARVALGREFLQRARRADGHAPAAQGQLRHFLVFRGEPGDPHGAARNME